MTRHIAPALLVLLALCTLPFVLHSGTRPLAAWAGDIEARGRLFHLADATATLAIYAHMLTGALITLAVPLQLLPVIRRRAPRLHRASGYALSTAALLTGVFGLIYIARQGSVGGAWMSGWFALYGGLMIVAAVFTVRHARARDFTRHRRWALRLMVLAVASFLYRVLYGVNFAAFDGAGVDDFDGWFDRAMVWAFYVPFLAALELWFVVERRRAVLRPQPR